MADRFDLGALWVVNLMSEHLDISNECRDVLAKAVKDGGSSFRAVLLKQGTERVKRLVSACAVCGKSICDGDSKRTNPDRHTACA